LNLEGGRIDSLYRSGTQAELEAATKRWLHETISRLEREQASITGTAREAGVPARAEDRR